MVYFFYRNFDDQDTFEFYSIKGFEPFYYADIIPIFASLVLIAKIAFESGLVNFIKTDNNLSNDKGFLTEKEFLYDSKEFEGDNQVYQRQQLVDSLLEKLNATDFSETKAFVVGIEGAWGSGKSTFIRNFISKVEKDKSFRVLKSSPWRLNTNASIQQNFFNDLKVILAEYAFNATKVVNDYVKLISPNGKKYLDFIGRNKLSICEYENLEKIIRRTGKKFVIVIDDLDRLTLEEFQEVFKLIRSAANFQNLIFVLGYDWKALHKTIDENVYNSVKYFGKLVNTQISLPPFDGMLIHKDFIKLIDDYAKSEETHIINKLSSISTIHPVFLKGVLPDKRQVYRFVNDYSILRKQLKYRIIEFDLVLLELLRYKFPILYDDIFSNPLFYLSTTQNGSYVFSMDVNNICSQEKKFVDSELKIIEGILGQLFRFNESQNIHDADEYEIAVANPDSIDRYYFKRILNVKINPDEMQKAVMGDFEGFKGYTDELLGVYDVDLVEWYKIYEFSNNADALKNIIWSRVYYAAQAADDLHGKYKAFSLDIDLLVNWVHSRLINFKMNYKDFKELIDYCAILLEKNQLFLAEILIKFKDVEDFKGVFNLEKDKYLSWIKEGLIKHLNRNQRSDIVFNDRLLKALQKVKTAKYFEDSWEEIFHKNICKAVVRRPKELLKAAIIEREEGLVFHEFIEDEFLKNGLDKLGELLEESKDKDVLDIAKSFRNRESSLYNPGGVLTLPINIYNNLITVGESHTVSFKPYLNKED